VEEVQAAMQRSVGQRHVLGRSIQTVVAAAVADQAKGKDQPQGMTMKIKMKMAMPRAAFMRPLPSGGEPTWW